MENSLSDKNILLITIGSLLLIALFTTASIIGFKSLGELFDVDNVKEVLGSAVSKNEGSSVDLKNTEQDKMVAQIDNYKIDDYEVMQGRDLGKLGSSDNYSFYLSWPVSRGLGIVTQCFNEDHNGVDIAHYSYPDVLAAAPGKVIFAGCDSDECPKDGDIVGGTDLARKIMIEHNYGFITVYGHLNNIYVEEGENVRRGQIIGQMGQTGTIKGLNGNEAGVHLHFSLIKDPDWITIVNPADYLLREVCVDGLPDKEAFY